MDLIKKTTALTSDALWNIPPYMQIVEEDFIQTYLPVFLGEVSEELITRGKQEWVTRVTYQQPVAVISSDDGSTLFIIPPFIPTDAFINIPDAGDRLTFEGIANASSSLSEVQHFETFESVATSLLTAKNQNQKSTVWPDTIERLRKRYRTQPTNATPMVTLAIPSNPYDED